jgi:hypothetical protein
MSDFHGEPTRILENQFVQLEILANSARIVRFSPAGGSNLFADLGKSAIASTFGNFLLRGGHRLWHAPEAMPRTYIPDNEGGLFKTISNGVRVDMPAEAWTHIAKSIEITLNPDQPQVTVRHELRNEGAWPVEFSAWALTMLKLGGIAIFPQPEGDVDEAGLLPNRQLSLWPYSKLEDPRLILRDDYLIARPTPDLPPFKFGYFNPAGWMGYWLGGTLFIKRFEVFSGSGYPDHGCNTECYFNQKFIELESLSPLRSIKPSETLVHVELWEIYDRLKVPFLPEPIQALIGKMAQPL